MSSTRGADRFANNTAAISLVPVHIAPAYSGNINRLHREYIDPPRWINLLGMNKYMEQYIGIPVSCGSTKSTAKVLQDIDDFDKVEDGDIIVVQKSFPGWVIPLIKASGLICEIGGVASHLGILCRELGKPCVSGIADACRSIADNDIVCLDGNMGIVYVTKQPKDSF